MEWHVGRMENKCLILDGKCKICDNDVIRLIEPEE